MKRFKNILIAVQAEDTSPALLARAQWLARSNGARLTLVHVLENSPSDLSALLSVLSGPRAQQVSDGVRAFHTEQLEAQAAALRDAGVEVETKLLSGVGFVELIRQVLRGGHDLLLKTADRTPDSPALGGLDLHLLRKCPAPVWILNARAEPRSARIMAAVDPDPEDPVRDALNHKVMQLATSLARQDEATLDVINAWFLPEESALRSSLVKAPEAEIQMLLSKAERESAARLQALLDDFGAFADLMKSHHAKGMPATVITEHEEIAHIDTLVMGTLGRTGLTGMFIGNTAETVLSRVTCSVLAVKPDGFISPVTVEEDSST
ncbi:MAG: universal stress protein [Pseudomonadota bacterium]